MQYALGARSKPYLVKLRPIATGRFEVGPHSRQSVMASEAEKIAFLEERIGYELAMLNYTFMRLVTARPSTAEEQLDRNAFLESFAIHARNLVNFLSPESQAEEPRAADYVATFETPDRSRVQRPLLRLERQILTIIASQTTEPKEKFNIESARELYTWIVPAILRFEERLAPKYRASLNALGSVGPT